MEKTAVNPPAVSLYSHLLPVTVTVPFLKVVEVPDKFEVISLLLWLILVVTDTPVSSTVLLKLIVLPSSEMVQLPLKSLDVAELETSVVVVKVQLPS